jgi:transcription termination/antitermination protein NusG
MQKYWYAVYTKPRCEKKVAEALTKRKFDNYCPLNKVLKQWHDRKKIVYEPLFTSYVFVHIEEKQITEVRKTDGIINFVYWLSKPAVIKSEEIETIQKFLNDYSNISLERVNVSIHDTVRITHGPLMNKEGNVVEINNRTVKIILPSLGYMMIAQVEKQHLKVITGANLDIYATA